MSMGYFIKIDGSPLWQARFPGKSGVEPQRSTGAELNKVGHFFRPIFYSEKSLVPGRKGLTKTQTDRWHYISCLPAISR